MPLLLGAGALGATRTHFLTAFTLARGLRYGFVAWLGATYGRHVLHWWNEYLAKYSTPVLVAFLILVVGAIIVGFVLYRKQVRSWQAERAAVPAKQAA